MSTLTGRSVIPALVFLLLASSVIPPQLGAATRTTASGDYSITTESSDAGGGQLTGGPGDIYRIESSIGGVAGFSVAGAPAITLSAGYASQLSNVTGLMLTAAGASLNETATLQLSAFQVFDDATFLAVPAASVVWSVQSGPLTGISAGGLSTSGVVFQNTAATVQGSFAGDTGTLGITVVNTLPDNFGTYAADGLDDGWQVQYFGQNNSSAAPALDPDGDGQTNLFEFTAGLVPTDPASRFTLTLAPVPGQPGLKQVIFSPRLTDRTYTVMSRPSLSAGSFAPLTNPSAPSDAGPQRTITDLSASGAAKYYRVEISKP